MTQRVLRSHSRDEPANVPDLPTRYQLKEDLQQATRIIKIVSGTLTPKLTGLSKQDVATLNLKRSRLRSPSQTSDFISNLPQDSTSITLTNAARATLVFAQHEAGIAVCIATAHVLALCNRWFYNIL